MRSVDNGDNSIIVLTGDIIDKILTINNIYDPSDQITEGQIRLIKMHLRSCLWKTELDIEDVNQLETGEAVSIAKTKLTDGNKVYILLSLYDDRIPVEYQQSLQIIKKRGALYTAKELYREILSSFQKEDDPMEMVHYSPEEALNQLKSMTLTISKIDSIALLLQLLSDYGYIDHPIVFEKTIEMLDVVNTELENNEYLDAANVIADHLFQQNRLHEAKEIYDKISLLSDIDSREALNVNCRLRSALIAKKQNLDANIILEKIKAIDDGLLNKVSHQNQVLFFTLQGYAHDQLNNIDQARGYHEMAVAISKSEVVPSVYFAESYAYLGKIDALNLRFDLATNRYLTASNIALNQGNKELNIEYADKAAQQELIWADILSSHAIHSNMLDKQGDVGYYIWQAIRKIIDFYSHSSDILAKQQTVKTKIERILDQAFILVSKLDNEMGKQVLRDINNQLHLLQDSVTMPREQRNEIIRFLTSKVTSMIPLPPPSIMLIGHDGRFLLGGEIGQKHWDQNTENRNVLFTGALTAIMSMLSEVLSDQNPLRLLDLGQTQIIIEKNDVCIGAVLVDRELMVIRKALLEVMNYLSHEFPELEDPMQSYHLDLSPVKLHIENIFGNIIDNMI